MAQLSWLVIPLGFLVFVLFVKSIATPRRACRRPRWTSSDSSLGALSPPTTSDDPAALMMGQAVEQIQHAQHHHAHHTHHDATPAPSVDAGHHHGGGGGFDGGGGHHGH